jgi:hypothetical protein
MTLYKEMKNQGIDIFNPNDDSFNDICSGYVDKSTLKYTTLNWRRANYYQTIIPQCIGFNCDYIGVNDNNYVECSCGIKTDNEYINEPLNYAIGTLTKFNFGVILCANLIPVNFYFI